MLLEPCQCPAADGIQVAVLRRKGFVQSLLDVDQRIVDRQRLTVGTAHPRVASVLGQPLRTTRLSGNNRRISRRVRVHGRLMDESRRYLDHRLADQHRHRIQIAGMGAETESLCFEGQRSTACERIVEFRQLVGIEELPDAGISLATHALSMNFVHGAGPSPASTDLGLRPIQHILVCGVLPPHQLFDELAQPFTFQRRRHFTKGPAARLSRYQVIRFAHLVRRHDGTPSSGTRRAGPCRHGFAQPLQFA